MSSTLTHPMYAHITRFLDYMSGQRGCSPLTRSTYEDSLTACADYLIARHPTIAWETVDTGHVREWLAHLMRSNYAPNTVNRSLSALRSFYRYLLREGLVSSDPAHNVRNPKAPKRIPGFVREGEMDRLFRYYRFGEDYAGRRDRTLLLLLYHTGLRAAEVLGLNLGDVDLSTAQLRVTGKGNKQRVVPFGAELTNALRDYLPVRREFLQRFPTDENALFLSSRGHRLGYSTLRTMVRTALSAVTTQQKKSPHVLRHSFATAMLNHGAQLEAIRRLLGHESVVTTSIYTHTTVAELRQQYAAAHPHDRAEKG